MTADLGFVHRFVPADPSAGAGGADPRTLLLLHGTGGDENDLIPLGRTVAPATALLSPRGQVLEHGMPRFFRRLAEGVFDLDDLRARAADLARFVAEATETYGLDPSQVVALGYSNGANIAAATMLLHPHALSAAVLLRPTLPLEPDRVPDLTGRRVLVMSGRADPYAPTAKVERLVALLRAGGAEVEAYVDGAGHGLEQAELAHVAAWLARRE